MLSLSPLLTGHTVRLTPLNGGDLSVLAGWQMDSDFLRLLAAEPAFPKNEAQMADWLREGQRGHSNYLFGIRLAETEELIGFLELGDILWNHRVAWVAIGIGARSHWGQGYGAEALGLLLDFAFNELNLHRVQLTVFSYNSRAAALYEKLGFQREGVQREALERDGRRYDLYLYGILRREWHGSR